MKKFLILAFALFSFTLASAQVHAPHVNYAFQKGGSLVPVGPTEFSWSSQQLAGFADRHSLYNRAGEIRKQAAISLLRANTFNFFWINDGLDYTEKELENGYQYKCVAACHGVTVPGYCKNGWFEFKFTLTITYDPYVIRISDYEIIQKPFSGTEAKRFSLTSGIFKKDGTVRPSKKAMRNYKVINYFANGYMNCILDNMYSRLENDSNHPDIKKFRDIFDMSCL